MADFVFTETKKIGIIGDADAAHKEVVLGHYNNYADKVYVFDYYYNRNGSIGSKAIAKFTPEEFKALKEMEVE